MVIKNKKETIYPIGFLENPKKTQLFARTKESPKEIFLVLNKKTPTHFSERKEHIIVKNKLFKTTLYPERMDYLSSAHVKGKDIITFLYGIGKNKKLLLASSKNDHVWTVSHGISSIRERGGIVSDYLHKKEYHIAYYGESSIWIAASSHFKNWIKLKFLKSTCLPRQPRLSAGGLTTLNVNSKFRATATANLATTAPRIAAKATAFR